MPIQIATYNDVRQLLQPGDVIAFAGDNALSAAIMKLGKADVSHVGIIVAGAANGAEATFIESTIRVDGSAPTFVATITPFPDRLLEYHGQVWWLPLSAAVRGTFKAQDFATYVHGVVGTPFDLVQGTWGVLKSPFDVHNFQVDVKTGDALFCSELVVNALQKGGIVPAAMRASRVMPRTVCGWQLYDAAYSLLKGTPGSEIDPYNDTVPA